MAIQKTEAIVLKTRPFRSSSLIVTYFTKQFGKIRCIAKGIHKEGERRSADFELFTHGEIIFYEKEKSDLFLVSETSILESHENLRKRFETMAYAAFFCELVDEVTDLFDPHDDLFEYLKISFSYLGLLPFVRLSNLFQYRLLFEVGWIPHIEECADCGKKPLESGIFSIQDGNIICKDCHQGGGSSIDISREMMTLLRFYEGREFAAALKVEQPRETERQVAGMLRRFILDRIGKEPKSLEFIKSLSSFSSKNT